jgi:hypothetical protein
MISSQFSIFVSVDFSEKTYRCKAAGIVRARGAQNNAPIRPKNTSKFLAIMTEIIAPAAQTVNL